MANYFSQQSSFLSRTPAWRDGTGQGRSESGLTIDVLRRTPARSLQRRLKHRRFDVTACQKLARLSGEPLQ
jgi:hypothetical protein